MHVNFLMAGGPVGGCQRLMARGGVPRLDPKSMPGLSSNKACGPRAAAGRHQPRLGGMYRAPISTSRASKKVRCILVSNMATADMYSGFTARGFACLLEAPLLQVTASPPPSQTSKTRAFWLEQRTHHGCSEPVGGWPTGRRRFGPLNVPCPGRGGKWGSLRDLGAASRWLKGSRHVRTFLKTLTGSSR